MSAKSQITQVTNATKVLLYTDACAHKHCNTKLYGWGHCFWGILNNAFLHQRKLVVMFSFFPPFLTNAHARPNTGSTKYTGFHKVSKDGEGKTVVVTINNSGACAKWSTCTHAHVHLKKKKKTLSYIYSPFPLSSDIHIYTQHLSPCILHIQYVTNSTVNLTDV